MSQVLATALPQALERPVLHADQHLARRATAEPRRGADAADALLAALATRVGSDLDARSARRRARPRAQAACPGSARIAATSASQDATGLPSTASTRSPAASPARSAAPPATTLPDHRVERRPVEPQADALERVALDLVGREARAGRAWRWRDGPRSFSDLDAQRSRAAAPPAARASAAPARSRSARRRPRAPCRRARSPASAAALPARRLAEHRPRLGQPVHEQARVDQDGEQEVEHRPGDHDGEAPPDALPVEGARAARRGATGALALVEHLHVAAERDRGDHPLGLVAADAPRPAAARPKPTEKRSTLTPHRRATR